MKNTFSLILNDSLKYNNVYFDIEYDYNIGKHIIGILYNKNLYIFDEIFDNERTYILIEKKEKINKNYFLSICKDFLDLGIIYNFTFMHRDKRHYYGIEPNKDRIGLPFSKNKILEIIEKCYDDCEISKTYINSFDPYRDSIGISPEY